MKNKDNWKVIVADDHDIMLDGYCSILGEIEGIQIVGKANNGKEVLTILDNQECDLIILDINMPQMNGVETAQYLKERKPEIKIIILTMLGDVLHIKTLYELGVEGYLLKNCNRSTLIESIEIVQSGERYFDKNIQKIIDDGFKTEFQLAHNGSVSLSEREIEIIRMISLGFTTNQIADELFISPNTVQTHRKNINLKLNIHNSAELSTFAARNGIICL